MEAMVEVIGDVNVVHIKGRVDYETVTPFNKHLVKHLVNQKVVLHLRELQFVGSVGIVEFVAAIQELSSINNSGVKIANAGVEYRRIFESAEISGLAMYENLNVALLSYQRSDVDSLPRLSPSIELLEIGEELGCDLNPD